jgi:hypothetical protein
MKTESALRTILVAALATAFSTACTSGNPTPQVTHDGLRLVPNSKMERAWVRPGEDFSQYQRVGLLECFVAFKKDWRMNHPGFRTSDMDRIKKELSAEFRKVFTEVLEKNGYPIATSPAKDVLLVRPALVDLEITAPDTMSDVDSLTFTTSAGSVELYVELYDSETNELLARAADRRAASHIGEVELTSFSSNEDDARRLLEHWANVLVSALDEFHGKKRS